MQDLQIILTEDEHREFCARIRALDRFGRVGMLGQLAIVSVLAGRPDAAELFRIFRFEFLDLPPNDLAAMKNTMRKPLVFMAELLRDRVDAEEDPVDDEIAEPTDEELRTA